MSIVSAATGTVADRNNAIPKKDRLMLTEASFGTWRAVDTAYVRLPMTHLFGDSMRLGCIPLVAIILWAALVAPQT